MGRTAEKRWWHRTFNKSWVHPDHPTTYEVLCWFPNFIPLYPVNIPHSVEPRNGFNFVVSFRHISQSGIRVCERNTGTFFSINTLFYRNSTYQETITNRVLHELWAQYATSVDNEYIEIHEVCKIKHSIIFYMFLRFSIYHAHIF
jgi:hypothetical protein